MSSLLTALHLYIISPLLGLLALAIIVYVVLGWLFAGGVVPHHNQAARSIYGLLQSVIEPLARPIRRIVPPLGQLDLSVLLLILIVQFANGYLIPTAIGLIPF